MAFKESVIFQFGADSTQLDKGMSEAERKIKTRIANMVGVRSKAEQEYSRVWKQAEAERDRIAEQNHKAELRRLDQEKIKRLEVAQTKWDTRKELVAQYKLKEKHRAEGAAIWATKREEGIAAWRADLARQKAAQGITLNREVKNTAGVNIANLQRNVKGANASTNPYMGGNVGAMVGGQIAGDIASGAGSKDIIKGIGGATLLGTGMAVGGTAGAWMAKKAISKLGKQFISKAISYAGAAAGGLSAIPVIGTGIAGIYGNVKMRQSLNEQAGGYGTIKSSHDVYSHLGTNLSQMIIRARAQGKITEEHAMAMMKALEKRNSVGVQSVQRDLGKAGVQTERERMMEQLQAQLQDRNKMSVDEMADHARSMTGQRHRRNYALTPRMRTALQIQDLEEQAQVAFEAGDDATHKKLTEQANDMRSKNTWMKELDKTPQLKMLTQLELIASRLDSVDKMATESLGYNRV